MSQPTITPEQALQNVDNVLREVRNPALNRQEHLLLLQSVQVLTAAIKKPEPAQTPTEPV